MMKTRYSVYWSLVALLAVACSSDGGEQLSGPDVPPDPAVKPVAVNLHEPCVPALGGTSKAAVWRLDLTFADGIDAFRINRLCISFGSTQSVDDIRSVALYVADGDGKVGTRCVAKGELVEGNFVYSPKGDEAFVSAVSGYRLWLTVALNETVDIDHMIVASCTKLELILRSKDEVGKQMISPFSVDLSELEVPSGVRRGVALRRTWQDNVCRCRIPGLVTTPAGTMLAVFDARHDLSRDLQGNIDIGLHRSIDGGRTWQPLQIVMDMGAWGGLPEKYNGVSDPCILVDDNSGKVFVAACWMHGIVNPVTNRWVEGLHEGSTLWEHQWTKGASGPGWDVKETTQFLMVWSDDDGLTWSEPINLTEMVKPKSHNLFVPSPGRGITLTDGMLVMPTQGRNAAGTPYANILYSVDGGSTWDSRSSYAYLDGGECAVAELSDGSLMLNTLRRANGSLPEGGGNGRGVTVTTNLGKIWTEHPTSCSSLIEPPCQASLLRHHYTENGELRSVLLFFNPAVAASSKRNWLTLKASFDDGATWPEKYWTVVDELSGNGYSCMTSVGEEYVGILLEGSQADLEFVKVSLDDILKRKQTNP